MAIAVNTVLPALSVPDIPWTECTRTQTGEGRIEWRELDSPRCPEDHYIDVYSKCLNGLEGDPVRCIDGCGIRGTFTIVNNAPTIEWYEVEP